MRWDHDITESLAFGRGENWIEYGDSPPIAEEMTLVVSRPWLRTEVESIVDTRGKVEVGIRGGGQATSGRLEAIERALDSIGRRSECTEESASLRRRIASFAVSIPNRTVPAPVRNERSSEHIFDTLAGVLFGRIGIFAMLPRNENTPFSLCIDREVHIGKLKSPC